MVPISALRPPAPNTRLKAPLKAGHQPHILQWVSNVGQPVLSQMPSSSSGASEHASSALCPSICCNRGPSICSQEGVCFGTGWQWFGSLDPCDVMERDGSPEKKTRDRERHVWAWMGSDGQRLASPPVLRTFDKPVLGTLKPGAGQNPRKGNEWPSHCEHHRL